jgi:hypothetical protein
MGGDPFRGYALPKAQRTYSEDEEIEEDDSEFEEGDEGNDTDATI